MEYWISRNIVAAKAAPTETLYVIRYKVESFQRLLRFLRFLRFLRLLTVSPYHPLAESSFCRPTSDFCRLSSVLHLSTPNSFLLKGGLSSRSQVS
jgi:hypothetical protein